ncbi:TonB-dependent receptor [bacterium]|nr:TonB-dependent receptor [bacterium]
MRGEFSDCSMLMEVPMRVNRVGVWSVLTVTLLMLSLFLLPTSAFAQTGKLRGVVLDATTDDPVVGANVVLVGSKRGAASDLDGNFTIVAIQPGKYTVRASAVGYATYELTDVEINIDVTTTVEIKLQPSVVEGEVVTVIFEKPEVELGVTSKVTRVTSEDLSMMASDDVSEMIATMPGIKLDEEGRIHIRGGRETEARFMVDGIDSRDPITGEILPINLSAMNVQEIQILTGGMSAEYGQAMSGLVQITTPEGAPDQYNGIFEWATDSPSGDYSFGQDKVDASFGGPIPFTGSLLPNPITFYLTGNMDITDTYTPLGVSYDAQDYVGLGVDLPRRQYNDWSGSLKLAYTFGQGNRLSAYFQERRRVYDLYPNGTGTVSGNYAYDYLYNLDRRPIAEDRRSSWNIDFSKPFSDKSLLTVEFGRQMLHASVKPGGKDPDQFTLVTEIEEGAASGTDVNENGRWDQDADGDGVIHSDLDELGIDVDGNGFLDGYVDANNNGIYDGNGEGYEDLNQNGRWDAGEDFIDINGNGVYDFAEPWTDRSDPVTGVNNEGVWDPWDEYTDLNGNGRWDPAEPQTAEQDLNGNGRWDGERFQDANGNGAFDRWEPFEDLNGNGVWDQGEPFTDLNGNGRQDDGEGYDDANGNGVMDQRDLIDNETEDRPEPWWDGDLWFDTGEPFIDLPDPITGEYNGSWDEGEPFWDLPTSNTTAFNQLERLFGLGGGLGTPTLNGKYDPPNGFFDEYELFTFYTNDRDMPVGYTWNLERHGAEWVYSDYLQWDDLHSTWTNRTLHDEENPEFNPPNFSYDEGEEKYIDYNGNGEWNNIDLFLNPGVWDNAAVWQVRETEEYTFRTSFQSQVHENHEFKTGVELKRYYMEQQEIQGPDQLYEGEALVDPSEPFPERGSVRDFWDYAPWEGAVYLQDKMEFEGLIVQAGLRMDFVVHDQEVVDESKRRAERDEPGAVEAERWNYQVAPRLGISHPITSKSKLYFNYGHFYQRPSFLYYYKSTTTNINEGTVGNPNLEFEKTVTYELGVHTQLSRDFTIQIAGYYRDIYDMISTVRKDEGGITIYQYVNLDYGRSRGFEVKLEKKYSDNWNFSLNYDFSFAYGKSSSANEEFVRRSLNQPVNYDEYPLDWDETHRITANAALMYGPDEFPVWFGFRIPVDDWLLTTQWQFGSGRPYTPSQYTTGLDPNLIQTNSERMPWTETTSVRFEKYFSITERFRTIVGFEVRNLFDKQNWRTLYEETGSPYYAVHPLNDEYNPFVDRYDYDANPRNFGAGRQILFRVGFEF